MVAEAYRAQRAAETAAVGTPPVRVFVPIWMDPLMTVHGSTFISDVLARVGAENVFADRERRYPLAADLGTGAPLPADRVADRDVRYPRVTLAEVTARAPSLVGSPDEAPTSFRRRRTRRCSGARGGHGVLRRQGSDVVRGPERGGASERLRSLVQGAVR